MPRRPPIPTACWADADLEGSAGLFYPCSHCENCQRHGFFVKKETRKIAKSGFWGENPLFHKVWEEGAGFHRVFHRLWENPEKTLGFPWKFSPKPGEIPPKVVENPVENVENIFLFHIAKECCQTMELEK